MRIVVRCIPLALAACLIAPAGAFAQDPWRVVVTPTMQLLAVGACAAIHLSVLDSAAREVPRNALGYRVTIADFDIAVTTPDGRSVAAQKVDASHWSACGCQGGVPGTTATVVATYPAQSLAAASRIPGVSFQRSATFTLAPPNGTFNPPVCTAPSTVATTGASPPPVHLPQTHVAVQPAPTPAAVAAATAPAPLPSSAPPARGAQMPAASPPAALTPMGRSPAAPTLGASTGRSGAVVPINPTGFTAVQTAPGRVVLSWQPVSGVSYYGLFGPGVSNGGEQVMAGTTTFTATNVPGGMHQWSVGSYYNPGQVTTGVGTFPTVALTVTAPSATASGKYLVSITGLRAYQASHDDLLSRDGVGDEVYAAAYVRRYDRSSRKLMSAASVRTMPYGDVNHFGPQRVQAGTRSGTGGIQDGDPIPAGPLLAARAAPPQPSVFPLRLWEGTLADAGDALVISPSLWEQDGVSNFFAQWEQRQAGLNSHLFETQFVQTEIVEESPLSLFARLSKHSEDMIMMRSSGGTGGGSYVVQGADTTLFTSFLVPMGNLLLAGSDRPIGMIANGAGATMLPNHTIVLTREIIEKALSQNARGPIPSLVKSGPGLSGVASIATVPGIIVIEFSDGTLGGFLGFPERPARYHMFIQVERVP